MYRENVTETIEMRFKSFLHLFQIFLFPAHVVNTSTAKTARMFSLLLIFMGIVLEKANSKATGIKFDDNYLHL